MMRRAEARPATLSMHPLASPTLRNILRTHPVKNTRTVPIHRNPKTHHSRAAMGHRRQRGGFPFARTVSALFHHRYAQHGDDASAGRCNPFDAHGPARQPTWASKSRACRTIVD
ncbi:TPA: hypothetical protein ACFK3P_11935 [Neisseria gonorrhoeae]